MVCGEVKERKFWHWGTQRFLEAANRAATIELTTSPTASWYWRGKLESREWTQAADIKGDIGEILNHGKYASEILKEYVFEEVRTAEFCARPSRKRCIFLFDATLDADTYASAMKLPMEHLFEVELLAGNVHRASFSHLSCNLSLVPEARERARSYWSHTPRPGPETEVLFEGECRLRWLRSGAQT